MERPVSVFDSVPDELVLLIYKNLHLHHKKQFRLICQRFRVIADRYHGIFPLARLDKLKSNIRAGLQLESVQYRSLEINPGNFHNFRLRSGGLYQPILSQLKSVKHLFIKLNTPRGLLSPNRFLEWLELLNVRSISIKCFVIPKWKQKREPFLNKISTVIHPRIQLEQLSLLYVLNEQLVNYILYNFSAVKLVTECLFKSWVQSYLKEHQDTIKNYTLMKTSFYYSNFDYKRIEWKRVLEGYECWLTFDRYMAESRINTNVRDKLSPQNMTIYQYSPWSYRHKLLYTQRKGNHIRLE